MAENPILIIPIGLVFAVIYYFLFKTVILKFDLMTPGREDEDFEAAEMNVKLANDDFTSVAAIILEGLGGKGNLKEYDYCATRIRAEVTDYTQVDEKKIKSAGVAGIVRPSKTSVQVVIGPKVQFVYDELRKLT